MKFFSFKASVSERVLLLALIRIERVGLGQVTPITREGVFLRTRLKYYTFANHSPESYGKPQPLSSNDLPKREPSFHRLSRISDSALQRIAMQLKGFVRTSGRPSQPTFIHQSKRNIQDLLTTTKSPLPYLLVLGGGGGSPENITQIIGF